LTDRGRIRQRRARWLPSHTDGRLTVEEQCRIPGGSSLGSSSPAIREKRAQGARLACRPPRPDGRTRYRNEMTRSRWLSGPRYRATSYNCPWKSVSQGSFPGAFGQSFCRMKTAIREIKTNGASRARGNWDRGGRVGRRRPITKPIRRTPVLAAAVAKTGPPGLDLRLSRGQIRWEAGIV